MNLTPLMVHDKLTDFDSLKVAVIDRRDPSDGVLHWYAGNWWTNFALPEKCLPQGVQDVLNFWRQQYPSLPVPLSLPPLGSLNVNTLLGQELLEAFAIGQDSLHMLDKEINRTLETLEVVSKPIQHMEALQRDLKSLEEKKLAEEIVAAREEVMLK